MTLSQIVVPPAAHAAFPGGNGKIVFSSDRDGGDSDIFVMGPDGSNPQNLTELSSGDDTDPALSADGTRIAFVSTSGGGDMDIYVMGSDGSNPQNLTQNDSDDTAPAFSPDGTHIIYTRQYGPMTCACALSLMGADGSDPHGLTVSPLTLGEGPQFSPDGTLIVWSDFNDIMIADANGSNVQNLTASDAAVTFDPTFSPDGTHIAFARDADPGPCFCYDVYVMGADGSNPQDLTAGQAALDVSPAFSPDGTMIAFQSYRNVPPYDREVVVMPVAGIGSTGMNQQSLTSGFTADDHDPDWQALPDTTPPDTKITKRPKNEIGSSTARYKFVSTEPESTFECKLDKKKFKPCGPPKKLKRLHDGGHKFQVRAIDPAGNVDPKPAKDKFRVAQ